MAAGRKSIRLSGSECRKFSIPKSSSISSEAASLYQGHPKMPQAGPVGHVVAGRRANDFLFKPFKVVAVEKQR